jgi:hypothetical protein
VLFFGIPAASFDLASFSIQMPICASLAKHTPATKHNARVNTLVFTFMSPPLPKIVGLVYRANSSAGRHILQLAILSNVYSVSPRLKVPVGRQLPRFARSGDLAIQQFRRGN